MTKSDNEGLSGLINIQVLLSNFHSGSVDLNGRFIDPDQLLLDIAEEVRKESTAAGVTNITMLGTLEDVADSADESSIDSQAGMLVSDDPGMPAEEPEPYENRCFETEATPVAEYNEQDDMPAEDFSAEMEAQEEMAQLMDILVQEADDSPEPEPPEEEEPSYIEEETDIVNEEKLIVMYGIATGEEEFPDEI